MTVVHYLNQFFAGLGGEEAADHEPVRLEGSQGPGQALVAAGLQIDLTVACGDDRFALDEADSLATLLAWIEEAGADVDDRPSQAAPTTTPLANKPGSDITSAASRTTPIVPRTPNVPTVPSTPDAPTAPTAP